MPNYNVSLAEFIIPASDISEHISTAGTEASGTSNMKFAMNGGLILGTMDGANIELAKEVGEENMFIFGLRPHEIADARKNAGSQAIDERLYHVIRTIHTYMWSDEETTKKNFNPLVHDIQFGRDFYLVAKDFPSYIEAQQRIDETWIDKHKWTKMCIHTIAGCGKFSSDRTILEYARDIWDLKPCRVPDVENKVVNK